jgi:two-component system, LytTR family, response regulator
MPEEPLRVMIADDEPIARRGIRQLLCAHTDVTVVGEARNGRETVQLARAAKPDLIFLDIEMPGLDGFDVVARVQGIAIIFVTAYESFAVRAFDVHAVDYLLKPVTQERFDDAFTRARKLLERALRPGQRLMIGDRIIDAHTIRCIEAADYYAAIHRDGKRSLVRESLDSLEARLDPAAFVRTHRAYIVNLAEVVALRSEIVLRDGMRVPISRRRRRRVEAALRRFVREGSAPL